MSTRIFNFLLIAVTVLGAVARCQTPPSFSPSTANRLGVVFENDVAALCPGCPLSSTDTASAPRLSLETLDVCPNSTYLTFMIDIDVIRNGSQTHLLHWYRPDLVLNRETRELLPKCSDSQRAKYGGPSPPEGTMHRYVELLFAQPADYTIPKRFSHYLEPTISARLFFNITEFMDVARLHPPVAASYFTVSGGIPPAQSVDFTAREQPGAWWLNTQRG